MKFIKFLFTHFAFLYYFGVLIAVLVCLFKDPTAFTSSPLFVQIGMTISIVGGGTGMGIMLAREYKASQTS